MKKIVNILLIFMLAVTCMFTLFGCDKDKDGSSTATTGLVCELKTDEDGQKYAVAKKYTLSEEDSLKVSKGDYKDLLTELVVNEWKVNDTTYPVKEIDAGAFTNQLVLKKVTIGSNVKKVGNACFAGCANLEELVLNHVGEEVDSVNSAKTLGYLFGTSSFTGSVSVTVNHATTGSGTTYYVPSSLKKVTVTGDVLADFAFYGLPLKEVELTGNVEYIGEGSFANMSALNKVKIPASVKEIGKSAFANSTALYSIDFSSATALTTIYQEAFAGCLMLGYGNNTVTLPNSLSKLYSGAFKNCTNLKAIDLTNTAITEIPSTCFYGCSALKEVKYKDGTVIGNDAIPENK